MGWEENLGFFGQNEEKIAISGGFVEAFCDRSIRPRKSCDHHACYLLFEFCEGFAMGIYGSVTKTRTLPPYFFFLLF